MQKHAKLLWSTVIYCLNTQHEQWFTSSSCSRLLEKVQHPETPGLRTASEAFNCTAIHFSAMISWQLPDMELERIWSVINRDMEVSINGGTPKAGGFISWKIPWKCRRTGGSPSHQDPPIFIIQAGGMMLKSQGANQEVMQPAMRYLCLAYAKTLFNVNSCSITCSHVYQIM